MLKVEKLKKYLLIKENKILVFLYKSPFSLYYYKNNTMKAVVFVSAINKKKLTVKQKKVYDFIRKEIREKGFPPSIREICAALGLSSTSSVHSHLSILEDKGLIRRSPYKNRTIEILETNFYSSNESVVNVPVVEDIGDGAPILALQKTNVSFPIPSELIFGETFIMKVPDNSMIEKGIFDNDFVLVSKQPIAENGDIIVALLGDSVTVKCFFRDDKMIRLQPANQNFEPIITEEVEIIGKVVGLLRKY